MDIRFSPEQSALLAGRLPALARAAQELALFGEADPDLAAACGAEVCALEARSLLSGGSLDRAARAMAASQGKPAVLASEDVEALGRLEAAVARGSSRIGLKLAALEAEASQEALVSLGGVLGVVSGVIGIATGAVGLVKSVLPE